jgi:hypothetical protein
MFYFTIAIMVLTSLHIWIHSYKDFWTCGAKVSPTPQLETYKQNKNGYFQETKNIIIGAGGTLVAIALIVVFLVPSIMARRSLVQDPDGINFGGGRAWAYIHRMTMPVLSFVILPLVIIGNNDKMRKVLIRELKDSFLPVDFH